MDNRETSTPSSDDPIRKRHLFSGVAKNWVKGRGDVGRVYFVRRPSRQSFGFRAAASSGPFPKAPGSAGGYLLLTALGSRRTALAQPRRSPFIVVLSPYGETKDPVFNPIFRKIFDQALTDLGWIDASNIRVEYHDAGGDFERLRKLAAESVALHPDLIGCR